MDLDAQQSNGQDSSVVANGHPPQPYTPGTPPAPVYHPPIARRRPPPPDPVTPSQMKPGFEPTPKRKRSSSPIPAETPESANGHGPHALLDRAMRDQTVLGSPAAVSASSSLSDPPASPRPEMPEPIAPPPSAMLPQPVEGTGTKAKGMSFSSPVKRSARIRDRQAPASTTKATPQRTPGGSSGRNVRRKTESPVDNNNLTNGAASDSPAPANAPRTRTRSAATGARRKSSRIA